MPIKSTNFNDIGLAGVEPRLIYIDTNDTLAAVTTAGYLNNAVTKDKLPLSEKQMAMVTTKTSPSAVATQVALLEVSYSGGNWSLVPTGSPGNVVLPTVANYISHFNNTTGTMTSAAADVINAGDIQAGLSGTAGEFKSFPGTAARGSLLFKAIDNAGDHLVTVSNASHGQASIVSIPDGGQATSEFIIADSAGTQSITSGNLSVAAGSLAASTTVTAGTGFVATTGNLRVDAGNVLAGSDANAGTVTSYPATTVSGVLQLAAVDNAGGDFDTVISNAASVGQDQVISIPDVGQATGSFLVNVLAGADVNANIINFDVTVGQAALATGGTVTLQASSGSKQYKIRELYLNSGGTNFSGGGGDRLATISDGTSDYSVIPAANLQALTNNRWGDTPIPFPASVAINTSTAAGAALTIAYSGGSTDYSAGSMVISGVVERVA